MKMLLLAFALLALSYTVGNADSAVPTRFGLAPMVTNSPTSPAAVPEVPKLTIAPLPDAVTSTVPSSPSEFAQLAATRHSLPISPGMALALVALFVLALRVLRVNHAHAMAEHERHSHHDKAEMFRWLHAERAGR